MLKHLNPIKQKPARVVVLGSKGFVGSHILQQLQQENCDIVGISKNDINLLTNEAEEKLLKALKLNDVLVIISSIVPCKSSEMLIDNIRMMQVICNTIQKVSLSHVIYISSDAVYSDDMTLISENAKPSPSNLHGTMHFCRENMLKCIINQTPLAILRPSILYGMSDPHNSYGPNRFLRQIENNQDITLFGEGEEKRDHVYIGDVAKIASLVIHHKSEGILNIATGESCSFKDIANDMLKEANSSNVMIASLRNNAILHRYFDNSVCYKAFPHFQYVTFKNGLKKIIKRETNSKLTVY